MILQRLNPMRWRLLVKAPLAVAFFMLIVSAVITNAVLARLAETQQRHLIALAATYLDGVSAAVTPYVLRDDTWEVYDAIDRGAALGGGFGKASIVVVNAGGGVIAATEPRAAPVGSADPARAARFAPDQMLAVDTDGGRAHARRPLVYQGRILGTIYADFDISQFVTERRNVLWTLIITNAAIAFLLAALAFWVIRRMLVPLRTLSGHLDRSLAGPVEPIEERQLGAEHSEFGRLFRSFNAMAEAVNDRESMAARLASEERLASLGRLASGMAHEINNPLGGLFNAIDTLKRHGRNATVRNATLDLIERGLRGIRDVVRAALATYRADRDGRPLSRADIDDLKLLVAPELARQKLGLIWTNNVAVTVDVPASAVRQALLNLILNAARASPAGGSIAVSVSEASGRFMLRVEDQGPGLPAHAAAVLTGAADRPAPIGEGTGLGLWMTRRLVSEIGGAITIDRSPLGGAMIEVTVPLPSANMQTREDTRHVA